MKKSRPLDETFKAFTRDTTFHNLFRYNAFSEDIEFVASPVWDTTIDEGKTLDDDDLIQMKFYLTSKHSLEPAKSIVGESCFILAKHNSYNPVKQYIESEKWDGTPRLDSWLNAITGCVDNVYTRDVSAKMMIACVNRVYNPGCKFDHMVIFEGEQGIGKSTMIEELAGRWYLDTNFDNKDKDIIDAMRGSLIIEVGELAGMNKKDVNWMKSFITRKVDRVRLAYASRTKDFKRKSIFVGTYNPSGNNTYLNDDTGNRRFWPVECMKIDIPALKLIKRQLWAEAFNRKSERYYIDNPESLKILDSLHKDRELEGPSFIKTKDWLDSNGMVQVTGVDIIEKCWGIKTDGRDPKDLQSHYTIVGLIMRKLKWVKGTNEKRHYYFKPEAEGAPFNWEE